MNEVIRGSLRVFWAAGMVLLASAALCGGLPARAQKPALFEPDQGCYLGAYIDFDSTLAHTRLDQNGAMHVLPEKFEKAVGKPHSVYFFYLGYGKRLPADWVRSLARRSKFVHIALEPNNGMESVKDDAYLRGLARELRDSGARVFLRFASEMNGRWTRYHRDPALYRRKFRLVYRIMHECAPNVALVWCPYIWPAELIADYYPGDDATDWVGVNLYNVLYHNNRSDQPAQDESPVEMLQPFYDRYAARKPMMICEYGVTHRSALDNLARTDFAADRITELYAALPLRFPRIKCINYFDGNTLEFVPGTAFNDYSVTNEPTVRSAYSAAISTPYFLGGEPNTPDAAAGRLEASRVARSRVDSQGSRLLICLGIAAALLFGGAMTGFAGWQLRLAASERALTAVLLRPSAADQSRPQT